MAPTSPCCWKLPLVPMLMSSIHRTSARYLLQHSNTPPIGPSSVRERNTTLQLLHPWLTPNKLTATAWGAAIQGFTAPHTNSYALQTSSTLSQNESLSSHSR